MLMKGVVNLLWMMVYNHVISNQLSIVCWGPVYWKKKHLKSPWKREKIEIYIYFFSLDLWSQNLLE